MKGCGKFGAASNISCIRNSCGWVAVDRGLRLADRRSFPADRDRWLKVRDTIYEEIMEKGWSETRNAFVQRYGSEALDAANLMMPWSSLSPRPIPDAQDPGSHQPVSGKGGLVANALVHRYNVNDTEDGLRGEEGTFNICTFWLVEALTRAGRVDEARLTFEQMLGYANHVGLYAEETGHHGEGLGNFPQAFTHLALDQCRVQPGPGFRLSGIIFLSDSIGCITVEQDDSAYLFADLNPRMPTIRIINVPSFVDSMRG